MVKRKQYTKENLEKAISAVKTRKYGTTKASKIYQIPERTLRYRIKKQGTGGFPTRCLSEEQEIQLVKYIVYCAERAFPMSRKIIKAFVREMLKMSGNETTVNLITGPSNKWFKGFMKRHPEVSMRTPDSIDRGRYGMTNETVINNHFDLLRKTLDDLDILDKPSQIFNVDETGFSKSLRREKVCIEKSKKHAYARNVSTTDHITATLCISGGGNVLPTFVIYEKSFPSGSYRDGIPKGWLFGTSQNGYMDGDLFLKWFNQIFIPNCHKRPSLLILDNHESHLTLPLIQRAREEKIELYGLPPHTTHVTQPLDVAMFKSLKAKFSELAVNLGYARNDLIIGKSRFAPVLSSAIDMTFSPHAIKESFRKTGIMPYHPQAIEKSQLAPKDLEKLEITESEGNKDASEDPEELLCHACGHFQKKHPLVRQGLIPESLAELFIPIIKNPPEKKRRIITSARVITGDEMFQQLKKKDDDEVEKKRKQEERKTNAAKRKESKELKKKTNRQTRKKSTKNAMVTDADDSLPLPALQKPRRRNLNKKKRDTVDQVNTSNPTSTAMGHEHEEEDEADDITVVCGFCNGRDAPTCSSHAPRPFDGWIACDVCDVWYHTVCEGLENSAVVSGFYVCSTCCNTGAEE